MNLAAVDQTLAHSARSESSGRALLAKISDPEQPVAERRAGVCARCAWRNHRRPRRLRAGERVSLRRHRSRPAPRDWRSEILASEVPVWDPDVCIQCGKCVLVCPHAVIRSKVYDAVRARRRAFVVQVDGGAAAGLERPEIHAASGGGRLHGLRHLRRCLPGAQQIRSAIESH